MASLKPRSIIGLAKNLRNAARSFNTQSSSTSKAYLMPTLAGASTILVAGAATAFMYNKTGNNFQLLPALHASALVPEAPLERTFIMIKPDGVKRGLIADIIKRFEQRGYKLIAMKMVRPDEQLLNAHYCDLKTKPFFTGLVTHISSAPVVAMVWEGKNVVKQGRQMLGETDPLKSKPGSIRGDFSIDMGRNIIHGSDSVESANAEIALWFKENEIMDYSLPLHQMVFE